MILIIYDQPLYNIFDQIKRLYDPKEVDNGHILRFKSSSFGMFNEEVHVVPASEVKVLCCGYVYHDCVFWLGEEHYSEEVVDYCKSRVRER